MKLLAGLLILAAAAGPAFAQHAEPDRLSKETEKLKADNEVLLRQVEVYAALLKELNLRLEKLQDGKNSQSPEQERPGALELLQRQHKVPPAANPASPSAPASTPIEGKVTAVAGEIGLVVLSMGRDQGAKDGDEFTVYRGGEFVAKIVIDRSDRNWSAGKVVLKKTGPRVGDDVSNRVFLVVPRAGPAVPEPASPPPTPTRGSAEELRSLRKELDDVRDQVRQLSDRLVPSWQDTGVSVEEASGELRTHLGISRGLLIRRVREDSAAAKAGLQANDVVPDLGESQLLDLIAKRLPVPLIRRGQRITAPK